MSIKQSTFVTLLTIFSLAASQAVQLNANSFASRNSINSLIPKDSINIIPKDSINSLIPKDTISIINKDTISIINKPSLDFDSIIRASDFTNFVGAQNAIAEKTWIAKLATDFDYKSEAFLQSLIGAQIDQDDPNIASSAPTSRLLAAYPMSYDLRSVKPDCWSINYIRHQGQCGSCWAVAGATALSDRFCYKKPLFWFLASIQMRRSFSYQDPLECCSAATCGTGHKKGCNGGYINGAYKFAKDTGIVTGENFGNNTNCKNYFLSPLSPTATAPACRLYCTTPGYSTLYSNEKYKISSYQVYSSQAIGTSGVISATMAAIYNRGSVTAFMEVYNDFFVYSTGVYVRSKSAVYKGGHAVRLIGWGFNLTIISGFFRIALGNYWIGANSWGQNWGINGYFHIRRGTNECKIESYVVEGYV